MFKKFWKYFCASLWTHLFFKQTCYFSIWFDKDLVMRVFPLRTKSRFFQKRRPDWTSYDNRTTSTSVNFISCHIVCVKLSWKISVSFINCLTSWQCETEMNPSMQTRFIATSVPRIFLRYAVIVLSPISAHGACKIKMKSWIFSVFLMSFLY